MEEKDRSIEMSTCAVPVLSLNRLRSKSEHIKKLMGLPAPDEIIMYETSRLLETLDKMLSDLDGLPTREVIGVELGKYVQRLDSDARSNWIKGVEALGIDLRMEGLGEILDALPIREADPTQQWAWEVSVTDSLLMGFTNLITKSKSDDPFYLKYRLDHEDEDTREVFSEKDHRFYWDALYKDKVKTEDIQHEANRIHWLIGGFTQLHDCLMDAYLKHKECGDEVKATAIEQHPLMDLPKTLQVLHRLARCPQTHWDLFKIAHEEDMEERLVKAVGEISKSNS
jgi:hypothetical protein